MPARYPRFAGVEEELPLVGAKKNPRLANIISAIVKFAGDSPSLPSLPFRGKGGGVSLANGGRIYHDVWRLELCTACLADPWQLAANVLANRRFIVELLADFSNHYDVDVRPSLARSCFVSGLTSGTHVSHLTDASNERWIKLGSCVFPLVSILLGAGGISKDLRFLHSLRGQHLESHCSQATSRNRGLVDLLVADRRPDGYARRQHTSCDSSQSHRGILLTYGLVALVDEALGRKLLSLDDLQPLHAISTLHRLNFDYRRPFALTTHRSITLLELAAELHARLEPCVDDLEIDWAAEIVCLFRETIEALESPQRHLCLVDWQLHRHLLEAVAAEYGYGLDDVAIIAQSPHPGARFVACQEALLAASAQYFELVPPERSLHHQMAASLGDDVEVPASLIEQFCPYQRGRHTTIGQFVFDNANDPNCGASWTLLTRGTQQAQIDPWQSDDPHSLSFQQPVHERPRRRSPLAIELYDQGQYRSALAADNGQLLGSVKRWILTFLGRHDLALESVDAASNDLNELLQVLLVYRYAFLQPPRQQYVALLRRASAVGAGIHCRNNQSLLHGHWGTFHFHYGCQEKAIAQLKLARRIHPKADTRNAILLAHAYSRANLQTAALEHLARAEAMAEQFGYEGDLAVIDLIRAKTFDEPREVREALLRARRRLARPSIADLQDPLNYARLLLIDARLGTGICGNRTAVRYQLIELQRLFHLNDPLLDRLVGREWNTWTGGGRSLPDAANDRFMRI